MTNCTKRSYSTYIVDILLQLMNGPYCRKNAYNVIGSYGRKNFTLVNGLVNGPREKKIFCSLVNRPYGRKNSAIY